MADVSDKELKLGYFISLHKEGFFKALYGAWVVINAFLILVLLAQMVVFFRSIRFEGENKNAFSEISARWYDPTLTTKALDPSIDNIHAIEGANGRYKLMAEVANKNTDWAVRSLEYRFIVNGVPIPYRDGFLLPGKNYLASPHASRAALKSVAFEMKNLLWKRIDFRDNDKLSFAKFTSRVESQKAISETDFFEIALAIKNDSPFSFFSAPFLILAQNGNEVQNFIEVTETKFISKEERQLKIQLERRGALDPAIVVIPRINVLNDSVFMPLTIQIPPYQKPEQSPATLFIEDEQ